MTNVAVLVVSCDRYSDLWRPFFELFRLRWPDCPFPIFLGSNWKQCEEPGVVTINVGDDLGWGANLRGMLSRVGFEHVIIFLEDFFLLRPVRTEEVIRMLDIAISCDLACLRLKFKPRSRPSYPYKQYENLGVLKKGCNSRISTQVSIWDTEYLMKITHPTFTAWDFETAGTIVSDRIPGEICSVYDSVIYYRHAVQAGRWLETGLRICEEAGIQIAATERGLCHQPSDGWPLPTSLHNVKVIIHKVLPASVSLLIRRSKLKCRLWRLGMLKAPAGHTP
ncbi:MAG: hypothetical protein V1792_29850 [Pseudomonadota bacterium]